MTKDSKTFWAVTVLCAVYATVRYNVFKGVSWSEWPVYVLNKVFALSSLLLLLLCVLKGRRRPEEGRPALLTAAWWLMLMHVGVSLAILTSAYYPKYYQGDKLTWQAGWSMLLGVVAAVLLHLNSRPCERGASLLLKLGIFAFLSGVHAMLLGYAGWFTPATWPGHMIPITLISFAAGALALGAALWPRRSRGAI